MQIDLNDAFARDQQVLNFTTPLEMEQVSYDFGTFSIVEKKLLNLTITHKTKRQIVLEGDVKLKLNLLCDRCLKEVPTEIEVSIDKEIDFNNLDDEDEKQEISNFITGYALDTDQLVCNEILVNWPMKVLCQEDCKGICKKCGKNLNEGSCECDQTELDPRMAAIRDIFYEHYKEV